ncbi:2-C-methyl-D-erythritol 4-phosphate cytidylyltransferase [Mechercharimyces sp. CAU 1602]|uniref:IspD/TarI family cytidylyltransferase n=1 Tax=Mechercharimyces sp. CAU 1602 TaxID=2973933 RepID=UPI0021631B25|nr:IspD/TarI family cytidylyltransferase [Mechercharimyces sp. CAU 1602]MCS1351053.1 2-C-methyl-D-erythritol 4-phosphate cytidylyltransferase [Mechercharimyces sp. CAU 1602]
MKNVSMILLAGGIGTRMKVNTPKQFLQIGGKPMIIHVLEKADRIDAIREIIIPSPHAYIEQTKEMISRHSFAKSIRVIEGGSTRQDSVHKALAETSSPSVIIHEAVRPFVLVEEIEALIQCPDENATYGFEIPFTVLQGKEYIEKNLDRNELINIQLPQKFNRDQLLASHRQAITDGSSFTEDVSLFFHYQKGQVKVMPGTEYNIKITRPIDQKIGEVIYKEYILGGE